MTWGSGFVSQKALIAEYDMILTSRKATLGRARLTVVRESQTMVTTVIPPSARQTESCPLSMPCRPIGALVARQGTGSRVLDRVTIP